MNMRDCPTLIFDTNLKYKLLYCKVLMWFDHQELAEPSASTVNFHVSTNRYIHTVFLPREYQLKIYFYSMHDVTLILSVYLLRW
jgi:hypothetical protein